MLKNDATPKVLCILFMLFFVKLPMLAGSHCLCQETADINASWTRAYASDGNEFFFGTGINCGDSNQDGRDPDNSDSFYHVSRSGNAIVHFGVTDQVRYPGTHSVMMFTDANIHATCNQNNSVERAEINAGSDWRRPGRAEEGNTVWMGWSEIWTDIDESHTTTILQFRSNYGTGSPACQINLRPNRQLQLRTRQIPVYKSLGTLEENVWYDWIVEIKYSKTNSGYIKVWLYEAGDTENYSYSDPPTAQILNNPTMLTDDACPHLRWGVYRWESGDKMPSDIRPEDRLMTKYIGPARWKYGNDLGAVGFDAVKPRPPAANTVDDKSILAFSDMPNEFCLLQNYPNPFNPSTTISFRVPEETALNLAIYNQRGELVQTLYSGSIAAGEHRVVWNGVNSNGERVSSGVYLCRLSTKNSETSRKLLLIQ